MSADSDFAARRSAEGVVYSNGFDDTNELEDGTQEEAYDSTIQSALNSDQKTSGASSLRFKLRAGVTNDTIAGSWVKDLGAGTTFVEGDHVYYQWRQRFDQNWITAASTRWNSSTKLTNFHGPNSTCQGSEFTCLGSSYGNDLWPSCYTACGNGFETSTSNFNKISSCPGDCLIQQGSVHSHPETTPNSGYNGHYQDQSTGDGNGEGWLVLEADVWYTFYVHIYLAAYGGSSGNVFEAFIARDNGPYKQYQHCNNWTWSNNLDNNIRVFRLETYMTELPSQGQAAQADAYTWYDELIISTQPIAAPDSSGAGTTKRGSSLGGLG